MLHTKYLLQILYITYALHYIIHFHHHVDVVLSISSTTRKKNILSIIILIHDFYYMLSGRNFSICQHEINIFGLNPNPKCYLSGMLDNI